MQAAFNGQSESCISHDNHVIAGPVHCAFRLHSTADVHWPSYRSSVRAASDGKQPGGNVIDRPTTLPGLGDKCVASH